MLKLYDVSKILLLVFVLTSCTSLAEQKYVHGVCSSEIPSTWHVRSAEDQAVWNREGSVLPPSILTAEIILRSLQKGDAVPFKPAVFSMAERGTELAGHSEDSGAEDVNRHEIDVLRIAGKDVTDLHARLLALRSPLNQYYVEPLRLDGREALKIRNIRNDGKYYGLELILITESAPGKHDGLIFYNRSNDAEMDTTVRTPFRKASEHFFETIRLATCPEEWSHQ